ncbi:MAG: hypothetical protein CL554_12040 [Algoriphagus sp.]|uniref:hypothetical protein n=1 Tax=unclassified Algoriphagus TaxID=2641541 RepID=UPI000C3A09C6|nr:MULTISPECIES: hypothetical protein [unclassified Algoriphagus]MAL14149.1 hypothetical protein [Algoriphagus sp.]QYH39278.1 hypothetical protein GYM62_10965 [Algoriphagus sp. NBT04N3]HCB47724.1 hypothetical protein [Algoriphagus sp.]|tara:strand:- start:314 stop:1615 length:1302 start_codon:yes stop_codon:yes gene_type:complete
MKMKNKITQSLLVAILILASGVVYAQQPALQYFRPNDKNGLNVFEPSKEDTVIFDGLKVRVGGDFAMQFQGIRQSNTAGNLTKLGSDFNLPSANLNLDVQVLDGVRMHLRTYLSSRAHNEAWVKGGYMRVDNLDFVKPGFLEGVMKYTSITIGLDEFNYGDAHFRRTDNARGIFNPFVGNYLMDAFSTEAFGELTVQKNGLLAVVGLTNGKLNQNVTVNDNTDNKPSFYGKLGFDKQLNEDFRVRLTGSWYINNGTSTGTWLYGGDRAGTRYYNVLYTLPDANGVAEGGPRDGRFNARFTKLTALQINPFIKFKGLEFFGIYELANGNNEFTQPQSDTEGGFTQLAAELLYRFGTNEKFYIGGRYNTVNGKMRESATENLDISRLNLGGGWFISKNVLTKLEYVKQSYNGEAWTGRFAGAEFSGVIVEAVISF